MVQAWKTELQEAYYILYQHRGALQHFYVQFLLIPQMKQKVKRYNIIIRSEAF
jgi:hypothetical protein